MVSYFHAQIDARVQSQVQIGLLATNTEVAALRTAHHTLASAHHQLAEDHQGTSNALGATMATVQGHASVIDVLNKTASEHQQRADAFDLELKRYQKRLQAMGKRQAEAPADNPSGSPSDRTPHG